MDERQIQQVRRFNRAVTQRTGALEDSYLRLGRPLGEARIIYETGRDGADVSLLRTRLGLDSGYLSRLLRSLEAQGLVRVGGGARDGRLRRARLTDEGKAEFAKYDALSDQLASSMLARLDETQRERLVIAMADVERLLQANEIDVRVEAPDSKDALWCLNEYFQELATRFDTGFDPSRSNPARIEDMMPPAGFFVVARLDGRPVGCGALKRQDDTAGEIKRMWTAPSARGQGIARGVLRALEAIAREAGLTLSRLETNRTLTEAQALYRREGYDEVAAFNDEPYAHHWFQKRL
jgi:DNA-binding MarR family transcriptional regulator/N-acetylglutamate synthase-like GNAT family acetyltransferase